MKLQIEIDGKPRVVELDANRATVDGVAADIDARLLRPGVLSLLIEGRAYRIVLEEDANDPAINDPAIYVGREAGRNRIPYRVEDPRSLRSRRARGAGADGPKTLKASMPGRVVRVLAAKGDAVEAGQAIVVIEAMKMQNELKAPKAGKVAELRVQPGDTVASGDVLAVVN